MIKGIRESLSGMRDFFGSYSTYDLKFRKDQLKKLKQAILKYENEIHAALYSDLKKSPEESWITEAGFIIAEINHTLKHLSTWMKPEKVSTNLMNLPSSSRIINEPLGVVLIIGPWNYPLQLLFTPLIGAIASGNCVALKPSELAPHCAAIMKKIIEEIYQPEYIILVEGEGAEIVPELMNSFRFNHVFFTGSPNVGKKIYEFAARQLIPVTLELGGKSPCVIEADADINISARRIAVTKFSNAGQMCVAPDYLLVHESIKEKFISALVSSIKTFYGDDASSSYYYGKIINRDHFNRLKNYIGQGNIIFGGKSDEHKLFIEPTIIDNVQIDATVMGEEIFGPILPVISFNNFREAKSIIERNPEPLAFYIFTKSREKEKQWLKKISFGGGCVNNASWHLTNFNLPFGGRGKSGIGAYHGKYSFDAFSHKKAVMKTPLWFDPAIKYPPFKGKLGLFKKLIR